MPTVTVKKIVEVKEEIERIPMVFPALRDVAKLERNVLAYMTECEKGGFVDEDLREYIFEAAVELFYGTKVWDYLNQFHNS